MPNKKIYSKIIRMKIFCSRYLGITPKSKEEMAKVFKEYKAGNLKIGENVKIEGRAAGGGFFATSKSEFKRIDKIYREIIKPKKKIEPGWILNNIKRSGILLWSEASIVSATFGLDIPQCNELLVMCFWAFDDEVRNPTKEDACGDENWVHGGRTKNLITESTNYGVEEFVIEPLSAMDRIKEVDYIGHINYNLYNW